VGDTLFIIETNNKTFWGQVYDGGSQNVYSDEEYIANIWYYLALRYDNDDKLRIFVNNSIQSHSKSSSMGMEGDGKELHIGHNFEKTTGGLLDEVRFSKIARNDSWLKSTYYSINNPIDFVLLDDIVYVAPCINETIVTSVIPLNNSVNIDWSDLNLTAIVSSVCNGANFSYVNISLNNGTFLYYYNWTCFGNGTYWYNATFNLSSDTSHN
ncbi:unnamed protein product, partial [marine sediment metagenome]